jgi:hypothetical protein
VGVATYAYGYETNAVELVEVPIPLKRLPKAWDGVQALLIADTHITTWGTREDRVLALLQNCPPPDLIFWGGDFLQGEQGIPDALRFVEAIQKRFPGVPMWGVLGNAEHKLSWKRRLQFVTELEAVGLTLLLNRTEAVTMRGETILLSGVDDPYYGHADLRLALDNVPVKEQFTLLLAHSPQIASQAARSGVDLMLSGHTHGGQIRLPLVGALKTQNPLCRRLDRGLFSPTRLAETLGYSPGGNLTTYITRGVGIALVPKVGWRAPRFLCRPEISLVTLRCEPE